MEPDDGEPKEERTLMEILAETEARKNRNMKWTRLPPPNMELYVRQPVVMLNWEDVTTGKEFPDNPPNTEPNADPIPDDNDLSNIDRLTTRLTNAERELCAISATSLQGLETFSDDQELRDEGVFSPAVREDDHVPPAPDFDDDDDDEFGNGSDMDLFADEDLDRLYDSVDQQMLQGSPSSGSPLSLPLNQSTGSNVTSAGLPPIAKVHPQPQQTGTVSDCKHEISRDVKPELPPQINQQQCGSRASHSRGGGGRGSSNAQQLVVGTKKVSAVKEDSFTNVNSRVPPLHVSQPNTLQLSATWTRSSSPDSKISPDSDDHDLPPVDWGHPSGPPPVSRINDEPKAHCSKDILQPSSSSSHQLVAEKCPICNFSFPKR